jgi:putative ABC transport system ATP-binding protein
MIRAVDLRKSYRKGDQIIEVLRGVTLNVGRGELLAVMGRSGSGKTTLLNILGCLDTPDSGSYVLDGLDVASANDDQLAELRNRKIGFIFQQFHLLERTSALRNVMLPMLYAPDAGDARMRAMRALEAVGLTDRADHTPAELSGGEQQRVAIARAIVNDPFLVLADEPTGNLDTLAASEILALLARIRDDNRSVIVVTHDSAVAATCERVLALEDGRIREEALHR